jgi:hypothetical protein
MPENHPSNEISELERQVLKALCSGAGDVDNRDRLASELTAYRWQDPDHKVVYEALRAIRSRDPKTRRDELPAQVTRMGFPDVDWRLYFEPEHQLETDLQDLIRRLRAATLDQR